MSYIFFRLPTQNGKNYKFIICALCFMFANILFQHLITTIRHNNRGLHIHTICYVINTRNVSYKFSAVYQILNGHFQRSSPTALKLKKYRPLTVAHYFTLYIRIHCTKLLHFWELQYHTKYQGHTLKGTTIISTPQNFTTSSSPTFI